MTAGLRISTLHRTCGQVRDAAQRASLSADWYTPSRIFVTARPGSRTAASEPQDAPGTPLEGVVIDAATARKRARDLAGG
jgi:hypothetical protein